MPDTWETAHGLNPASPADASTDLDGDGMTNSEEYLAGTDPNESASVLHVEASRDDMGRAVLSFTAMTGNTYTVYHRDDLEVGTWRKLQDVTVTANQVVAVPDTTSLATSQRYYRVGATPGP
jgi:hypothetical protein